MLPTDFHKTPVRVYTPGGVGDALWSLMWVWNNTDRPIHLYTFYREGEGTNFLRNILPPVQKVEMFNMPYDEYRIKAQKLRHKYMTLDTLEHEEELYLEINPWIESGHRLEDFLPNFRSGFKWDIPWKFSPAALLEAKQRTEKQPTIALYTSSVALNRDNVGFNRNLLYDVWGLRCWDQLVGVIKQRFKGVKLLWLGARQDYSTYEWLLKKGHGDIELCLSRPGDSVVALLKKVNCFISFQSGLSVISVMERVPTYMLYFKYVQAVMRSWCPPSLINNPDIYRSLLFDDWAPEPMVHWLKKHLPQETWI